MNISNIQLSLVFAFIFCIGCQTDPARQRWFDNKQNIREIENAIEEANKYPCVFGEKYRGGEFCTGMTMTALGDQKRQIITTNCIGVDHQTAPKALIGQCYKQSYIQDYNTNQKTEFKTEGDAEVLKWKK